jgi:peroxiredoxin family protein
MPDDVIPEDVDPRLAAMIDQMVEKKVDERLGTMATQLTDAIARVEKVERAAISDRATLLVFSGDFDKLMSAFIVATGAVAMGMEVSMYFTFWGLTALKKQTIYSGKTVPEKMVSAMMPGGPRSTPTSNMNMMGMGPVFFKHLMKNNNVETLPDLISLARELGVNLIACQMAMGVMGITQDELIDDIEYGGVATYLGNACDSKLTLFI